MVHNVKEHKAGFVVSEVNLRPDTCLAEVVARKEKYGHSTMPVTADGTANGPLVGIVTSRDYRVTRMLPDEEVREFITPR